VGRRAAEGVREFNIAIKSLVYTMNIRTSEAKCTFKDRTFETWSEIVT
jgi:hypothetical protein